MSAERDELRRLVDAMPDDQVSTVLARMRRERRPATESTGPPEFFGIATARRVDTSSRVDELLAEGFGRSR